MTNPKHEAAAQTFLTTVRTIMIEAMKLSEETSPQIFQKVTSLTRDLRELLAENTYEAEHALKARIRGQYAEWLSKL